jgi:hypothetical protein
MALKVKRLTIEKGKAILLEFRFAALKQKEVTRGGDCKKTSHLSAAPGYSVQTNKMGC